VASSSLHELLMCNIVNVSMFHIHSKMCCILFVHFLTLDEIVCILDLRTKIFERELNGEGL
jgi:hypothetical protein